MQLSSSGESSTHEVKESAREAHGSVGAGAVPLRAGTVGAGGWGGAETACCSPRRAVASTKGAAATSAGGTAEGRMRPRACGGKRALAAAASGGNGRRWRRRGSGRTHVEEETWACTWAAAQGEVREGARWTRVSWSGSKQRRTRGAHALPGAPAHQRWPAGGAEGPPRRPLPGGPFGGWLERGEAGGALLQRREASLGGEGTRASRECGGAARNRGLKPSAQRTAARAHGALSTPSHGLGLSRHVSFLPEPSVALGARNLVGCVLAVSFRRWSSQAARLPGDAGRPQLRLAFSTKNACQAIAI